MKTINVCSDENKNLSPVIRSWPECVEDSYERLVAAVTNFVAAECTEAH